MNYSNETFVIDVSMKKTVLSYNNHKYTTQQHVH